jgi:Cof subfamily protein (haloacid dehalogenase superfamily)
MLALDIDGTLIGSDKKIPSFTRQEIRRVTADHAVHIVLITARGPQSTRIIEEALGVECSYATYGGSLVWARNDDGGFTTLSETPLEFGDVRTFVEEGQRLDVHIGVYTRNDWIVNKLDYWGLREARNTSIWPTLVSPALVEWSESEEPVFKIMFRGDGDQLTNLEKILRARDADAFIHRMPHVIEIVSAHAVKLPAVASLANYLGYELGEIMAFGDSLSDVEMLEHVGVGVLMGNAAKSVQASHHVERTLSNDEDGIGVMLRKHFPTTAPFRT